MLCPRAGTAAPHVARAAARFAASAPSPRSSHAHYPAGLARSPTPLPSIVDIYCGADWAEREAHEYYAVTFEGRASTLPLMLPEGDPPGILLRHPGGRA